MSDRPLESPPFRETWHVRLLASIVENTQTLALRHLAFGERNLQFSRVLSPNPGSSELGDSLTKSGPPDDPEPNNAALDPRAVDALGRALRAHYDDLVHSPLPDKFIELLARLEEKEWLTQTQPGDRKRSD